MKRPGSSDPYTGKKMHAINFLWEYPNVRLSKDVKGVFMSTFKKLKEAIFGDLNEDDDNVS